MKKIVLNFIDDLVAKAIDGTNSNLDSFLIINEISKKVEEAKDQIKKAAYDEVERIGEKEYTRNGYKITCRSKSTYNFNHIKIWQEEKEKIKTIEERAKIACTKGLDVDSISGERFEPCIVTYSYFLEIKKC
jgi:hypothetical protein